MRNNLILILVAVAALAAWAIVVFATEDGTALDANYGQKGTQSAYVLFADEETTTSFSVTLSPPGFGWVLHSVDIHHTNALSTGTVTVARDAVNGSEHDTILQTNDMEDDLNWFWAPGRPIYFRPSDALTVVWAPDTNTTGGLRIVYEAY